MTASGPGPTGNELEDRLRREAYALDFFQVLRRIECENRDRPRLGESIRPSEEPLRLAQEPSLSFAPGALSGYEPATESGPPRLLVNFFGLLGPNGPLPLHLTEYARDRLRNANDPTFSRFLDVFHHRMLTLFYRAWARSQAAVSVDRPESDRYAAYVGSFIGIALPALLERDDFPDKAKLYYAGRLAAQTRNAEGLAAVIGDFFGVPAAVESFVGEWVELPAESRWRLTVGPEGGRLGLNTAVGARAFQRQTKFRVVMGPLDPDHWTPMLPGGKGLERLKALVRNYVGHELTWDLRLIPSARTEQPMRLGTTRLGWGSWLGKPGPGRERDDLIIDPGEPGEHHAA